MPEPPSVIRLNFWEARDSRGLKVVSTIWRLYPGPAPRLHALDPVTGRETALCPLPADAYHAAISPDGRTLYYVHYLEVGVPPTEGDTGQFQSGQGGSILSRP